MYTRSVQIHAKAGKLPEVLRSYYDNILPNLKKQKGFVDIVSLTSDQDPNQLLSVSFWNSKEDAERYSREGYAGNVSSIRSLLEKDPTVNTFNVEYSSLHKVASGKAA